MSTIVSLSAVKAYLKKEAAKTADDAFLTSLIEEYSGKFEQECHQPIATATTVYEWIGTGGGTFELPHRAVTAITALEYLDGIEWTTVAASAYILAGDRIVSKEVFRCGVLYRATLTIGYALDKIPADIANAVRGRVIVEYFDAPAGEKRFGIVSEKEAAGTDSEEKVTVYDRSKAAADWSAAVRRHARLP